MTDSFSPPPTREELEALGGDELRKRCAAKNLEPAPHATVEELAELLL